MYRVIVADDEPMAIRSICTIIEKRTTGFEVVGTAENGQEALQKIHDTRPDLVISDIKMPFLSGVELAQIVRREYPQTCFIIVSGYQDFEYAQSAVRSGVTDYLLKPIVPSALCKSLEFARSQIRRIHYDEQNRILRSLGNGESIEQERVDRYLPYPSYYGALLRRGGLPRRFSMDRTREIYSDIDEQYVVFGRDEMESLYLIPEALVSQEGFLAFLEKLKSRYDPGEYHTLIFDSRPFPTSRLQEKIRRLYQALDARSSIGLTQSVDLGSDQEGQLPNPLQVRKKEEQILLSLEAVCRGKKESQIQREIHSCYAAFEPLHPPQIWMEHFTREILDILRQNGLCQQSMTETEYLLGDAFFYATSLKMLTESLIDIFLHFEASPAESKIDSEEFFEGVERYLSSNLGRPLSLQELCHQFGISQTYMRRIFRKYSGGSFSQHLTELRMDRARELFRENPESFIKDVAALVGYEDQFYFSRIFRTYTGKSPSEYLRECALEKGLPL